MSTQPPPPPTTLFLSYSHVDWERVEPIVRAFEFWQWTVFNDRSNVLPGDPWAEKIPGLIERAFAVVVVWSSASIKSQAVKEEIDLAIAKGRNPRFFPIIIDREVKPPAEFGAEFGADLSTWNGDPNDAQFERVRTAIENPWTIASGMALIRDIKAMKTIRIVKRAAPAATV